MITTKEMELSEDDIFKEWGIYTSKEYNINNVCPYILKDWSAHVDVNVRNENGLYCIQLIIYTQADGDYFGVADLNLYEKYKSETLEQYLHDLCVKLKEKYVNVKWLQPIKLQSKEYADTEPAKIEHEIKVLSNEEMDKFVAATSVDEQNEICGIKK